MVERDGQSEVEFWQGHSLDDDCPWKNVERSFLDEVHSTFARPDIRKAFNTLKEFIETNEGKPVKRLAHGEQFRISEYPKGTIIRFSRDKCWKAFFGYKTASYEDEWGILTQEEFRGEYYDVIVGFSKGQLDDGYPPLHPHHMLYGYREVGKVVHSRTIEPDDSLLKLETRFKINRHQALRRINWIEVWRFGEEVRTRAEEYQTATQRLLNHGLVDPN